MLLERVFLIVSETEYMYHFRGNLNKGNNQISTSLSNITVIDITLSSDLEAVMTRAKKFPKVKNKAISVSS